MARFTKALRQRILDDFTRQNNGWFDPRAFVLHVRDTGPDHPAYGWFEWDDAKAAEEHRVWQARTFAQGLRIEFKVETVERGSFTVSAPQFVSPLDARASGGGYFQTDPTDAEHMAEFAKQAAQHLRWWLRRYGAVVVAAGGDLGALTDLAEALEGPKGEAAA